MFVSVLLVASLMVDTLEDASLLEHKIPNDVLALPFCEEIEEEWKIKKWEFYLLRAERKVAPVKRRKKSVRESDFVIKVEKAKNGLNGNL